MKNKQGGGERDLLERVMHNRFFRGTALFVRRYFDHRVARDSAALTYYLLFAMFPLLIFLSNLVGFFVANLVCWLLNRKYVFAPGRHGWLVEYALFLAGSGFAIFCGSAAIWALVRFQGMQTTYSFVVNVMVSVAVNFVVRKFFVFKG